MKDNKLVVFFIIFIIATVCIFSFVAGSSKGGTTANDNEDILTRAKKESNSILSNEKKNFNKISVDEYLEFYKNKDDTIVLVGRGDCQYCHIAEPIIQNIMFIYDLDIKYILTDDFDIESEEKFMTSNELLNSFSTPLLMIVSENSIKDMQDGLTDKNGYIEFFKKNNYIKE